MEINAKKDRLEINKIIENCLPLMNKNKRFTQECADAILLHFIESDESVHENNNTQLPQVKSCEGKGQCDKASSVEDYTTKTSAEIYNVHKTNSRQKKCGDTLTHQHCLGTNLEEGQVSKENDETTVDTLRGSQNAQNKSKVNQNG